MKVRLSYNTLQLFSVSFSMSNYLETDLEKVKPWSQLAHSCQSLSRFLKHEAARSISTPPGQDASPLQVTSPQFR